MSCFSCNRRRRHRTKYEDTRLSGDKEPGEGARKEKGKGLDAVAREGCPLQAQCPAEPKPETAAARSGDPEGRNVTTDLACSSLTNLPSSEAAPLAPVPASSPDMKVFIQELENVKEFQAHHLQERRKDLSSCQDCLRTLKAMRENLQEFDGRLQKMETKLGIQVPPKELVLEERKEEAKAEEEQLPTPQAGSPGEKQLAE